MTEKDYYRLLKLHDLGIDTIAGELRDYLTERFSNLIQYTVESTPNVVYFGKSKSEIIFAIANNFDGYERATLFINYNTVSKKIYDYFKIDDGFFLGLLLTHNIKENYSIFPYRIGGYYLLENNINLETNEIIFIQNNNSNNIVE